MQLQDVEVMAEGLVFPEGPVAMEDGSVVLCEIMGSRVSRVGPNGDVSVVATTGGGPNGAAVGPDGALYVCNNGGLTRESRTAASIQRVDLGTGDVDQLYTEWDGRALQAPNDLVFDETGNFWFTDHRGDNIFYARPDGKSITRVISRVRGPNGIGLSPAGDVLYWAETPTRQVHRRRLSRPGALVEVPPYGVATFIQGGTPDPWTVVVGLPGVQEFDSLAIDGSGAVCVGTLLDSGVTVVNPEDGTYEKYTLPPELQDPAVTNICFGGADLQTAYITCSVTGRLLSCRWPRPGLRLEYQQIPPG